MPGRTVAAAAERASVHRPERSSIALVAVAVTLGFASWQLLASRGDAVSDVLLDWWEGEDTIRGIGAELSIGNVNVTRSTGGGSTPGGLAVTHAFFSCSAGRPGNSDSRMSG